MSPGPARRSTRTETPVRLTSRCRPQRLMARSFRDTRSKIAENALHAEFRATYVPLPVQNRAYRCRLTCNGIVGRPGHSTSYGWPRIGHLDFSQAENEGSIPFARSKSKALVLGQFV
jgi:hypothetical protein